MILHIVAQGGPGLRHRPARPVEQVLDAIGVGVAVDFRQLPAVLALGPAQQAVQIGQGPPPRGGRDQGRRQAVGDLRPVGRPDRDLAGSTGSGAELRGLNRTPVTYHNFSLQ